MEILISTGISLALTALLDAFARLIIRWAIGIALSFSSSLLNPQTFTFVLSDMMKIMPVLANIDIIAIFKAIGWTILGVSILIAVFKSMIAPATGERSKSPVQYLANGLLTAFLLLFFFGIGPINGMLDYIGTQMNSFLGMAVNGVDFAAKAESVMSNLDLGGHNVMVIQDLGNLVNGDAEGSKLGMIIFAIGIAYGCIGAGITHVERYLSYMFYLMLGPICIAFNGIEETKDTCKQWIVGVVTQAITIIISLLVWRLFFDQLTQRWTIFNLAICLALLSLIKNSEKLLNSVGVRTMANQDSARSLLGAVATTGMLAMQAGRTVSQLSRTGTNSARSLIERRNSKEEGFGQINFANNDFKTDINNSKNIGDFEKALNKYDKKIDDIKSRYGLNDKDIESVASNMNLSESERRNANNALNMSYRHEINDAKGNQDKIATVNDRYRNTYSRLNGGNTPDKLPDVPKSNIVSGKQETKYRTQEIDGRQVSTPYTAKLENDRISIQNPDASQVSVNNVNKAMSGESMLVGTKDINEAILDGTGYTAISENGVHVSYKATEDSNSVDTIMFDASDGESHQRYAIVDSDTALSEAATVTANWNEDEAEYRLDFKNAKDIGEGMSMVPIHAVDDIDVKEPGYSSVEIDEKILGGGMNVKQSSDSYQNIIQEIGSEVSGSRDNYSKIVESAHNEEKHDMTDYYRENEVKTQKKKDKVSLFKSSK